MTRRRLVAGTRHAIDGLIAQLPPDDPERARVEAHAAKLGRACGCGLSATALTVALFSAAAYVAVRGGLTFRTIGLSLVFVLAAAVLGKATGLLVASLRLELLRWSLERTGQARKGMGHVDVH
jgi:hypothetical protein